MIYKDKLLGDFFDFLVDFVNSDIKNLKDSGFVALLYQYIENMDKLSNRYPLITDNRYAQIMDGVAPGGEILADRPGKGNLARLAALARKGIDGGPGSGTIARAAPAIRRARRREGQDTTACGFFSCAPAIRAAARWPKDGRGR